jgi:subtilisin family serine protease
MSRGWWRGLLAWSLAWMVGAAQAQAAVAEAAQHLIVAVADHPEPAPAAGGPPRLGYRRLPSYGGSDRALAEAQALARQHGLVEVAAWSITALGWRCMLYRLPDGTQRNDLLTRLARDPRVALAQALNEFRTLGDAPPVAGYNDPYAGLQANLGAMQAWRAHPFSQGEGVRIAVIDSAIDSRHPELAGRVVAERDFVGQPLANAATEPHGTQVAGVMAATAHNGQGIVGVAPRAQILAYRACWGVAGGGARCNSFTLAQALSAAIAAGAQVINLSLGGPRDALLEALAQRAMQRGALVVGALPPAGTAPGFPAALPGVIAVTAQEAGPAAGALSAPGRQVLTLAPGGGYDFASGSSLAAAQASGALALLLAVQPNLDAARARALLGAAVPGGGIDICQALQTLQPQRALGCAPRRSIEAP